MILMKRYIIISFNHALEQENVTKRHLFFVKVGRSGTGTIGTINLYLDSKGY